GKPLAGRRQHRRGIDPAAEENAERHIAHQPARRGLRQEMPQLFGETLLGLIAEAVIGLDAETPIAPDAELVRGKIERQMMAAGKLGRALIERGGRGQIAIGQKPLQRARIDRAGDGAVMLQRRQLAGKGEESGRAVIIKRLLAESVARQEHPTPRAVIDREGKHAIEPRRQILAPFGIAMDEDFRIRMIGAEARPARLEFGAKLAMIVDLAVEDDADALVRVPHRLRAAGDIDNRKPAMAEIDARWWIGIEAFAVRAAMRERPNHAREIGAVTLSEETGDAAHHSRAGKLTSSRTT